MKTHTLVVYHSADFDGLFCREVARKHYGDTAEYVGWNFGDAPLAIPSEGQILVMDLPIDRVFGAKQLAVDDGNICFLTDTPPPQKVELSRIVWIDHHKSSIESHPESINGYRIDGVSACRLAWQWFYLHVTRGTKLNCLPFKEEFVNRDLIEPLAVRLAGEYDIWDKRDPRAELFQHGLRSRELSGKWWPMLVDEYREAEGAVQELLEAGKVIQYVRDQEYAQVIKDQGFTFEWEGLTFLGCCSHECDIRSHLFAAGIKPEHQALFGFTYTGKTGHWRVSMYHAPGHEQHDLSAIAKKYNGGGHRGACGMILDKLPFLP